MSSSKPRAPGGADADARDKAAAAAGAPAPGAASSMYARFIPREELGSFSAWNPNVFGSDGQTQAPQSPPAAKADGKAADAKAGAAKPTGKATPPRPTPRAAPPATPTPQEIAQQVHTARQAGYQDGYRDGLAALENFKQSFTAQMTQQLGHQFGSLIEQLQGRLDALEAQLAGRMAGVALDLAHQVVRSEISQRPELVVNVAEEALAALLTSARHICLRLHPDDQAVVAHSLKEGLHARNAKLIADPLVTRGGVIVESDIAIVDASVEARWRKAAALLGSRDEWSDRMSDEPGDEA